MVHVFPYEPVPPRDALAAGGAYVATGVLGSMVDTFCGRNDGERAFLGHPVREVKVMEGRGRAFDLRVKAVTLQDREAISR
jgi:hypothetical protein